MTSLGELCDLGTLDLQRDARVRSLGFVEIDLDQRLVFAMDLRNVDKALEAKGVAAVLTTSALAARVADSSIGLATATDPRRTFLELHNRLARETDFYGGRTPTQIDATATVHPRAHLDSTGVVVGPGCSIAPGAVLLSGTTLGRDVRVLAGAVLGSEGFQVMRFGDSVLDFEHVGRIEIGDRAVIMANATVARAVFNQATRIGADCRVGNNAFVSHNTAIGPRGRVGHGAIVAGNCRIGQDVVIGPGAICLDRLTVGDGAVVTAGAVVARSVAAGAKVSGHFAQDHNRFLRMSARLARDMTR